MCFRIWKRLLGEAFGILEAFHKADDYCALNKVITRRGPLGAAEWGCVREATAERTRGAERG